ncbi:MAG: hypothetical protein KAS23_16795, partial [Anaerohalosphaera sp.]|nr:hypothetical protein [Anaerohalosphaera sp.]
LKRQGTEDNPSGGPATPATIIPAFGGLVAVDFRAGLALLPFLPMSPGDFKLILDGMKRGSLVQFDRGDLKKLGKFVEANAEDFADMGALLEKLTECEEVYRNSLPDITHNGVKLLYSGRLWKGIYDGAVNGWRVRNLIDEKAYNKIKTCKVLTTVFWLMGVLSGLGRVEVMAGAVLGIAHWIGPFESDSWQWLNGWTDIWWKLLVCGTAVWQGLRLGRKIWGRGDWRKHYGSMLSSAGYFARAIRGRMAESVIDWHRCGRVSEAKAVKLAKSVMFLVHLPLSVLPGWVHRMLTDLEFAKHKLWYIFVRPFALYFNAKLRNEWMTDMISEGKRKHILSDDDAATVTANLNEPYIQRYLVSLVVHMMTAPVTQIVSGIHAWIWYRMHPDVSSAEQTAVVAGILIAYQITPLSPGSFCRGLYTTCLAIYDRNFKDYNIALFLSYFKYLGYLAFPIQMTYRYPAMARFMAGHWATGAVHIVPVFGEQGALLERWVFCLFYNWPLTIRRRVGERIEKRKTIKPRYWHVPLVGTLLAAVFLLAHHLLIKGGAESVELRDIWYLAAGLPLLSGSLITILAGGATFWKRVAAAIASAMLIALLYTAGAAWTETTMLGEALPFAVPLIWRVFAFTIFSVIGVILTELVWPSEN